MRYLIRILFAYLRSLVESIWACGASLAVTYWTI